MLDKLTSADFLPYLNHKFHLHLASGETLAVELVQVADLGAAPPDQGLAQRRPFSIVFRCGPTIHLPQQIYRLAHEQLGTLDIFLVPIGPDQVGLCYEAVFN